MFALRLRGRTAGASRLGVSGTGCAKLPQHGGEGGRGSETGGAAREADHAARARVTEVASSSGVTSRCIARAGAGEDFGDVHVQGAGRCMGARRKGGAPTRCPRGADIAVKGFGQRLACLCSWYRLSKARLRACNLGGVV